MNQDLLLRIIHAKIRASVVSIVTQVLPKNHSRRVCFLFFLFFYIFLVRHMCEGLSPRDTEIRNLDVDCANNLRRLESMDSPDSSSKVPRKVCASAE